MGLITAVAVGLLVGYLAGRVRKATVVERDRDRMLSYRADYWAEHGRVLALLEDRRKLLVRMHDYQKEGLVLFQPYDRRDGSSNAGLVD